MHPFVFALCCLLTVSSYAQLPPDSSHAGKVSKLFHEEVIPFLEAQDSTPDWRVFRIHLIARYGDIGEEVLLMSQTIYSMQQEDWVNFSAAIIPYAKKYGQFIPVKHRHAFSEYMSRNAQLLYQSGHKEEGIRWQILALPLAPETQHSSMLETIEKMKKDEH